MVTKKKLQKILIEFFFNLTKIPTKLQKYIPKYL